MIPGPHDYESGSSNQLSYPRQHVYVSHRPIVKCGAKIRDYFILHKKLAYFFYSPIHAIHRRINRYISPTHKTDEVATKIYTQSIGCKGVTLNNAPPKLTIKICPARIMRVTHRNPLHEAKRSKAGLYISKSLRIEHIPKL